jgi:hypothetical protein
MEDGVVGLVLSTRSAIVVNVHDGDAVDVSFPKKMARVDPFAYVSWPCRSVRFSLVTLGNLIAYIGERLLGPPSWIALLAQKPYRVP